MLDDIVDVYLLLESNYTAYGSGKELLFMEKFRAGWLEKYQSKIQYVFLSFFHEQAKGRVHLILLHLWGSSSPNRGELNEPFP